MKLTPTELQQQLNRISDESYDKHQRLAELSMAAAEKKLELMKTCKNGKQVDMIFDATEEGREMNYLKIYLKGLSHKRTAIIQEIRANGNNSW